MFWNLEAVAVFLSIPQGALNFGVEVLEGSICYNNKTGKLKIAHIDVKILNTI